MWLLTRFQRVIDILDRAIGGPNVDIGVHRAFWRGLSRDEFVAKKVFGLGLVTLGNGAASNLVKALKGQSPFGADLPDPPQDAQFSRMPAGLPPVPDADITLIENWINDGCPDQPEPDPATKALRWRPTNAPVASSRTDDIWFASPQIGWALNSNGQILQTRDAGNSWVEQLHDEGVYFRCIGFADPDRGWAGTLTRGKTLFETTDGGNHWQPVTNLPALAPSAICGLSVVDSDVVFASGTNFPNRPTRLLKTANGGRDWTGIDMKPFADILVDIHFTSPLDGWVVGGKAEDEMPTRGNVRAVVLRTVDGGQSWVNRVASLQAELPLGEWGWKIQFLNESVGFVSLESFTQGAILKTLDGGQTWTRFAVNDPQRNANLEGIGFVDELHGWVGGWGDERFERLSSSETFDGGATWSDANQIGKAINRFRFLDQPVSVGYASGQTVYKYSSDPLPVGEFAAPPRRGQIFGSLDLAEGVGNVALAVTVPAGASRLTVRIWDRFGDSVRLLLDESNPDAGDRQLGWDGSSDDGDTAAPGCFIWRVTVDGASESRLVLLK